MEHFWIRPFPCPGRTDGNTWHGKAWSIPWIQTPGTGCSGMGLINPDLQRTGYLGDLTGGYNIWNLKWVFGIPGDESGTKFLAGKGSDP